MATGASVYRREDVDGVHEWTETVPAPQLRPLITGYTGFREERDRPVRRVETPSGGAVLVFSFGDPLALSDTAGAQRRAVRPGAGRSPGRGPAVVTSFAGGMSGRPVLTRHDGRQHGIQVRLEPPAVYALFGASLDEVGQHPGGVVELAELGGSDWGEQLGAVASWESRFALLDELLAARLARTSSAPAPEVIHAWRRLRASHGTARVADLVRESGLSHPTFLGRFRRQVGVGPKVAARVLRYERATALLDEGTRSMADLAATCGYADQAHLDREFAALAGWPPTQLARRRASSEYQSIRSILIKTGGGDRRTVAP